jgi:hypothetical protein
VAAVRAWHRRECRWSGLIDPSDQLPIRYYETRKWIDAIEMRCAIDL